MPTRRFFETFSAAEAGWKTALPVLGTLAGRKPVSLLALCAILNPLSVIVVDGILGSMPQAETWASISAFTFSATPRRFSTGAFEFGHYQRNAVHKQHRVGDEMPPSAGQFHLKLVDYQKVGVLRMFKVDEKTAPPVISLATSHCNTPEEVF